VEYLALAILIWFALKFTKKEAVAEEQAEEAGIIEEECRHCTWDLLIP